MEGKKRDVKKSTFHERIESGELSEMSNKELKNIISEILAEDLTSNSGAGTEPE